ALARLRVQPLPVLRARARRRAARDGAGLPARRRGRRGPAPRGDSPPRGPPRGGGSVRSLRARPRRARGPPVRLVCPQQAPRVGRVPEDRHRIRAQPLPAGAVRMSVAWIYAQRTEAAEQAARMLAELGFSPRRVTINGALRPNGEDGRVARRPDLALVLDDRGDA